MARDLRRRIRKATPPHRPLRPHEYRGATREGTRGWKDRAARLLEAIRELELLPERERELYVYRRLAGTYGAYTRWARHYERLAREAEKAGRAGEAQEYRARARMYEDLAGIANAILAEFRTNGFEGYVIDRLIQSAVARTEPTFPELDRIPGRTGEYLRALAEMVKRTAWARGRGMRDWGVIICDPGTLEYVKQRFPNYRFRVYGFREEHEVYEWDSRGGKKFRSRAVHTRVGYMRGSELDYKYITDMATHKSGIEHPCVELIPEG